ncbi:TetR/AcrR family transcriptional regulator [Microbacterium saccharophilum]|uniref:TetR/AcrR family transcriptional regulator n=1 Tax=Microbacterium saccharophilum TaxID=1213358 RepID=A0A5C8HVC6_9MICO|nr:TetR/AcrR family transcriptional regulator [Microbacterium saccharophilum]TXK08916.1 TetR/AcrR family transcriptional regulator [Microbacterium saccharophilum]GEP48060.1 TetR family transcriptional regulator [Microbacterium saccharophilum]
MVDASESARRGPYAKTASRRAEIIASATAIFSTHGYQGGSLRQIARQLDLGLTTVMHHFPTKVALLAAVLDQEDSSDPDAEERSRRDGFIPMVIGIVERNLRRQELVRMFSIISAEATHPGHEAHAWLVNRYAAVTASYLDLIAYDRAAGRITTDRDPELLAGIVVSGWEGIQIRWLADGTDPVEAMRTLLVDLLRPA